MSDFIEIKANAGSYGRRRLVFGCGINDAAYMVVMNKADGGKSTCPYYSKWSTVLQRCYDPYTLNRLPTYIGATVCKEWLTFSNFRKWMEKQDWRGKELDKDIINPGNKVYSPENCCFVPQDLNKLLTSSGNTRGEYPRGVSFDSGRRLFVAECCVNGRGKHLGRFNTSEAAATAYRAFKYNLVRMIAIKQSCPKVMRGLVIHADLILLGRDA